MCVCLFLYVPSERLVGVVRNIPSAERGHEQGTTTTVVPRTQNHGGDLRLGAGDSEAVYTSGPEHTRSDGSREPRRTTCLLLSLTRRSDSPTAGQVWERGLSLPSPEGTPEGKGFEDTETCNLGSHTLKRPPELPLTSIQGPFTFED